jgi:hypothetical protein
LFRRKKKKKKKKKKEKKRKVYVNPAAWLPILANYHLPLRYDTVYIFIFTTMYWPIPYVLSFGFSILKLWLRAGFMAGQRSFVIVFFRTGLQYNQLQNHAMTL